MGAVAIGSFAVPQAFADDEDDLREQREQVQDQIHQANDDLQEASRAVSRSTRRLERATTRLGDARVRLQRVRRDLWDARAERERLARALVRAEARLDRVAASLRAARADVADQRDLLRTTVLGMETQDDAELAVLDAITSSGSIEELLTARTAGTMILGREDQALTAYEAAEAALADWKDEVRDARDSVAEQKEAARQNLLSIRGLFGDARDTRAEIARLVDRSREARRAAIKARQRDRAAIQRLKSREARIKREILRLAAQAAQQNDAPTYSGSTEGLLQTPVSGPVTSPFGWRTHPIYGYWGLHDGTDFGAGCGAQLWAGESGTVINTYYDEVYGNRLYLSVGTVNGANLTLVYNHLSSYQVSEGAHVGRGDVVGYVGSTGWSTGCHLHFTVLRNGEPVDPMNYL
ncbi:peptidoglycan DD-metalloendopeptidase family protein [Nocardioides sp. HM23]|uniref:peptidoglycan DD-metalloendopeptidase family protein n=1 Tax=Nocardioides bizhenqiangii TaxID=3095076 RepID=UPI002ACA0BBF|nr:peptidoglycan DD-metalloendopeptidase family protein [Nocardioides sp. HM23]MDZ5623363.1 peptidoglycan DD-metalloendopeptidase family protein [Nocardioides sp. HM23]